MLDALVERRRPALPRAPLPPDVMDFELGKNLRSSKRGVAGGPSGMTSDHLRPLLSDLRGMKLLFSVGREPLQRSHPFDGCGHGQSRENDGARGRKCGEVIGCKDHVSTVGTSNHGGH